MAYYDLSDPFSVFFNVMKMKYVEFDESLVNTHFFQPNDKVNVFINMETIFKLITTISDLDQKLRLTKDFSTIMISGALNLAGHYKRFFVNNGLDTRVYLYSTSFQSTSFSQMKYVEDYRSYYLVKYNDNPKFSYFTELMINTVIPSLKVYCDFIPRVYYLEPKNIDSSVVPYLVYQDDISRKNVIISGELLDSQYMKIENFLTYIISVGNGSITCSNSVPLCIRKLMRNKPDTEELMTFYNTSYTFYMSLLASLSDRTRSVAGLNGVGPKVLYKFLLDGIDNNEITKNTKSPEIIGDIFHDKNMKELFVNNYHALSIFDMYQELTSADKVLLLSSRKDRFDNNALIKLNNTEFNRYKLSLEALCL